MRKLFLSLFAMMFIATGLVVAGCGDDDDNSSSSSSTATQTDGGTADAALGTESGAAELRATLTSTLDEHVYLAAIAIGQGLGNGLDSGEFKAAAATLDKNSVALSDAIGSVYGEDAGKAFLPLWRKHIGFFVDYAKAKATKDDAAAEKAAKDLDGYRTDFGAFLNGANPNLPTEAVAEELKPHVESVFAVVRAAATGSPKVYERIVEAASHMPNTANVLAGGIVKQFPDKFSGATDAGASELRALLTDQLVGHEYLAGIAIVTGVTEGLDSGAFKAAAEALDTNSVALSESIGSVYGDDAAKAFLPLWRKHIGFFVDYTKAKAEKDDAAAEKAAEELDGYRTDFGAFLEGANPNLPADAVAEALKPHVEATFAAIDSVVAGDGKAFDLLQTAASHMPMIANTLAGGIAKQFPDKFPAS
ncbi:copper amine oxidase [Paraconexibacter algicola]|uniref:Copper amine oxidase n=1 Tax=Paraconexibacter algicola TaxID=2133960 RepID=A0A2T4UMV6_9ACTN|nr:copper amine oxidase [Paraconexibacter algicola]PTL60572.1 copper amine oxidase [Paraconexibacter algicola]